MQVKVIPAKVETIERVIEPEKVQIEMTMHQAEVLGALLGRCNSSVLSSIYFHMAEKAIAVGKYSAVLQKAVKSGANSTDPHIDLHGVQDALKENSDEPSN